MRLKIWYLLEAVLVFAAGSLLHFVFDWTGKSSLTAWFSPVNESTWEHLKLLVFPMLLLTLPAALLYQKHYPGLFFVRLLSILLGMAAITVSFYTYTGILGEHFLAADIGTFLLGIAASCLFGYRMLKQRRFAFAHASLTGLLGLALLLLCFILFTWYPPHIPLFLDPHIPSSLPCSRLHSVL